MKKSKKDTGQGFNVWQGYVSSISSLLIALLMLMGILGMATSVIQEAIDKGLVSEGSKSVECSELVNCKKDKHYATSVPEVEKGSGEKMLELLLANQKTGGINGHRFHIQFPVDMDKNNHWALDLQNELKTFSTKKNAIWQIYTLADPMDAQQMKHAYTRNITVRQALLQIGVQAETIETLIDTEHTGNSAEEKASVLLTVVFD